MINNMLLFTGSILRGVFCERSGGHRKPEGSSAKPRFFAVCVHREACYWAQPGRSVKSNNNIPRV